MRDPRDRRAEGAEIVDIGCIRIHRFRQRFRLIAALLVGLVEHVLQLGVVREHALVKVLGDDGAVFGEHGNSGFDAGDLVSGERGHQAFS